MNRNGNSAFLWLLIITYYAHFVHNWLSTIFSFEDLRPFPTLIFRKSDSAIDQGGTSAVKNGPGPDWPLNPYSLIKKYDSFFYTYFWNFYQSWRMALIWIEISFISSKTSDTTKNILSKIIFVILIHMYWLLNYIYFRAKNERLWSYVRSTNIIKWA